MKFRLRGVYVSVLVVFFSFAANAALIFKGNFPTKGLSSYFMLQTNGYGYTPAQQVPGHAALVTDPAGGGKEVVKLTVLSTDAPYPAGGHAHRTELLPETDKMGTERWYATAYYIPNDWVYDTSTDGQTQGEIIMQFHQTDEQPYYGPGNPPIGVYLNNNVIKAVLNPPATSSNTSQFRTVAQWSVTKGKWTLLVFHIKWKSDYTGLLEIWKDGVKLFSQNNIPTNFANRVGAYMKVGNYHWNPFPSLYSSRTYYYSETAIGDATSSYAEVASAANAPGSGTTVSPTPAPSPVPTTNVKSLFSLSNVPANVTSNDTGAAELGVKFSSSVSGRVTGVRFYKSATNTGTHVGSLWTSGGTRLASVTFSGETSSGWQTAYFSNPVTISPNTTYIISYHTGVGHYSFNEQYFTSTAINNPPLAAPSSSVSGGNGVYAYGSTPTFPNHTYNGRNYWVDIIFSF